MPKHAPAQSTPTLFVPSVTLKVRRSSAADTTEPVSTSPPTRSRVPGCMFFSAISAGVEKRQAVPHRVEPEADRAADDRERGGDQREAAALAGQFASPRPRSCASASRLATALASGASALRASASAALALSS